MGSADMDLMCPHCQRRVTVTDDKAGQVASCPLCAKQFMAPALPSAPPPVLPPSPSAPAPNTAYQLGPTPVPPPSVPAFAPTQLEPMPSAPPPPLPPGDYTRTYH